MNFVLRPNKVFSFILMLLLSSTFVAVASGQKVRPNLQVVTIEKKIIEGKKYALLGDWEKAETIYRSILDEDPQNSAACYELARTLAVTGKLNDALTYVRKAIRLEPDNEWYLLMEADIHEKTLDLYSAMDIYDRLILLKPDRPHYYVMLISFCKKTEERERLLAVLAKYESVTGLNESITRDRFETLDAMGRTDEALGAIRRLTEVFPMNIEYKYLAASYCKSKGLDDQALIFYRQILSLDPSDSRARLAMAGAEKQGGNKITYLQSISTIMGNPSLSIDIKIQELIPYVMELSKSEDNALGQALLDLIDQLVTTHPKEAKTYSIKGDVLAILGQKEAAIHAYTTSTALNGNIYVVWEQLIRLLINTYAYDEVITQTSKAIDIFPNQAYLYYASGYGFYKKKRFEDALDMLNQALIMTGKNINQKISVYNVLGLVYDELGQADKSVQAFETALSINPRNAETLSQYSLVLSRRIEQSDKAIAMADKVLADGNQPATVHQWIAEVYYNQKKYEKARQSIEVAVREGTDAYGYNLAGDIMITVGETGQALEMWKKAMENGYPDPGLKKKIADHKGQ